MAKKFEWNKEVEDALRKANIPEEKIADLKSGQKDVEKIPLELLDGISGGGWGGYSGDVIYGVKVSMRRLTGRIRISTI